MSSPFDHPWLSGIFGDAEIVAILSAETELNRMLKVEAAWTRALGLIETEVDTNPIADRITALKINPEELQSGTARDGLPVPQFVDIIKSKLRKTEIAYVHTGLTSQDVIDTALVLALCDVALVIENRLIDLNATFDAMEQKVEGNVSRAFTRMQPALPTSSVSIIKTWQRPLQNFQADLKQSVKNLAVIQYGGPIGTRSHALSDKLGAAFAKNLGLKDPGHAWHTDRSILNDFTALLTRIAGFMGKIGADICQLAALGSDHVSLSAGGTSSSMPHKKNPVEAEVLVALARYCATQMGGLQQSLVHENHRSGQALSLEWLLLPGLLVACGRSVALATNVVNSIETLGCKS